MPASFISRSDIIPVVLTLAIAAAGGGAAMLLGLPAGWLMGGALAVTIAAMLGAPIRMRVCRVERGGRVPAFLSNVPA